MLLFLLLQLLFFLLAHYILGLFCFGCFGSAAGCRFSWLDYFIVLNFDPVSNLHQHLVNTSRLRDLLLTTCVTLPHPFTIFFTLAACHLLRAALFQLKHSVAASDAAGRLLLVRFRCEGRFGCLWLSDLGGGPRLVFVLHLYITSYNVLPCLALAPNILPFRVKVL